MPEPVDSVRDVPPPRLFKYRSAHTPDYARDRDIILGNALWAGSPIDFNDPFDCFPAIDTSGNAAERLAFAKRHVARHAKGAARHERRSYLRTTRRVMARGDLGNPEADRGGQAAWKVTMKKMGVVSLAELPDDMLMWGYYANSHQGYCLEFDTSIEPFLLANRVKYSADRPSYRPLDPNRMDLMERTLLNKADFWTHEKEWRIVLPDRVGALDFPPTALKSIILGANMPPEVEADLRAIVAERAEPIALQRAQLHPKAFKLSIVGA